MDGNEPGAMTQLRHEVVSYLERHGDGTDSLDEAEVVVSEAVGNAVRHAAGPVWVSLTWREVNPRLTVRDVGPGFDPEALQRVSDGPPPDALPDMEDLAGLGEGGRGFFLMTQLAQDVIVANRGAAGALVSVRLPVKRSAALDHDPPRTTVNPLPGLAEALPEGGFGKESFLRALVVQMARSVEYQNGPDAAEAAVAQVGADVGGQMEAEFRLARDVVGTMTPDQIGECYVRLKHAIDGGFKVVEANEQQIVLVNDRCPFGEAVQLAPALCRMTSSVFGGIAARNNDGPVAVLLEERIAVGDPGCRVVVGLDRSAEVDSDASHIYRKPIGS